MTISPTSTLSEPHDADRVPLGTLAYFRARLKQRIYNLVIKEFKKSGVSQADLRRRLGMEPAQLSRLLSGPGNLTLDTISDLFFGMSGAEPQMSTHYPLSTREPLVDTNARAKALPLPAKQSPQTVQSPGFLESLRNQADTAQTIAA